jgi:ESCRT-II complex subunit VPS22
VGVGAFDPTSQVPPTPSYLPNFQAHFTQIGNEQSNLTLTELKTQLRTFQSALQTFAQFHSEEIRSNPAFRNEFAQMCSAIGVDPLIGAGRERGVWGVLGVTEIWCRIAIRTVDVCRRTRGENGGLIGLQEVQRILAAQDRGAARKVEEISEYVPTEGNGGNFRDDIVRSINALEPLGPGISIVTLGNERYIRSIPKELNTDQTTVLEAAGIARFVSVGLLRVNLGWEDERSKSVLEDLVVDGMVWVDDAADEREYWIPRGISD